MKRFRKTKLALCKHLTHLAGMRVLENRLASRASGVLGASISVLHEEMEIVCCPSVLAENARENDLGRLF